MIYVRSFFLNFLAVFFINRIAPGIEIHFYEQVPNIGADLFFSAVVGCLNASIFPFLFIVELNPSKLKIAILTCIISFASFITIAIVPFGVRAVSAEGVLIGALLCWIVAYFTNYLEWHQKSKRL